MLTPSSVHFCSTLHIKKLTLNRDWAESDDGLDERALNSDLAVKVKENGKSIRWHLDRAAGTATPETPADSYELILVDEPL